MASWIEIDNNSDFSLQNLPYGIFSTEGSGRRIGVAVGEYILDMKALVQEKLLDQCKFDTSTFEHETLNAYAAVGKDAHREVRSILQDLLSKDTSLGPTLRDNPKRREKILVPMNKAQMHLPMNIGDYTDFFVGQYHAQNCSDMLRPGSGLPPNYVNLPVGYHGRASSIVVSGTPVRRPKGQFNSRGVPEFGPCQSLDFEVEFAAFIGQSNEMGDSIDVNDAENYIFGYVLMNDWSARDIQFWESTPLGPFNGKNFCTTISPWVVTPDALEAFQTTLIQSNPKFPYLDQHKKESVYDIPIQVSLETETAKYNVSECNTKNVIFSFAQMIAHHTAGGCPLRTGDLIATGTLSGATRKELGCLLEITRNGAELYEIEAVNAAKEKINRSYLEDGDMVEFIAHVRGKMGRVGFGACRGRITA
ncbi:hypothetical protein B7463_g4871, partial [Scytalidium lignicola]